jgi:DNA mismatch repair protein MutL
MTVMTLARIQQLPAAVANQIAAGEVIERPASVVKELLENALDSGANTIHVDIGFGGLNQVKVSDNGAGILAADLPLAIAAHATSKIRQLNDLYSISSMGFRGEALASISSVSKLSLSSKPATQAHAMMLQIEGGGEHIIKPCARAQGTTVDVVDLFFNAPVRKKFLKTARSEYQAIEMVVKRFALSAPSLTITLKHNSKEIFYLPAATCEKTKLLRIKKLLGKQFIENAIYLDIEQGGLHLQGWISGKSYQRSQNDKQWIYLNQRMVKDKLINHAVKQGYEDLLHPGRYPACLLYLTVAAADVDVNVHPTKHEVRFQQPRLVHDFISSHISNALVTDKHLAVPTITVRQPLRPLEIREAFIKNPLLAIPHFEKSVTRNWLILNSHFGVVFLQDTPYLVDIVRAQQQWLLSLIEQQTFPLASRPLLVPVSYSINKIDGQFIEQHKDQLAQLGINIDWVGESSIVVRTIPLLFPQLDIKKLLHGLTNNPDTALLNLIVNCQSFDAHQLNQDDKAMLADYLSQQMSTSATLVPWCLRFDTEKCSELFGIQQYV